ncbi:uncharacterized protein FOBCDRAFT_208956 [Fusarium oxysporum Fo47]|uniref:uncharacterized protein n=1 Tax=Fusarium oxysporum Fo47 TaxID=660027 RepID=UPI001598ECEE|nr:uncharacterized protein FOBCDRAFT_208956 [Fusarium oxysporum Fo47]QKD62286.1 hypothetical protein FOBCDRAFT_208956 [Fusarium oxysporum Fo47]
MRMRLYDETSLSGPDPIEQILLRNAFWQLYVCDKTALVIKTRPVLIHEPHLDTVLTLEAYSRYPVLLFDHGVEADGARIKDSLLGGSYVVRRLWALAPRVIQGIELHSKRNLDPFTDMEAYHDRIANLSEAYFEMITLTNNHPVLVRTPDEPALDISRSADQHLVEILQRQRTSYLISLYTIKVIVLHLVIEYNVTEVIGLSSEPLILAMRQIELAQDFLNALESALFLHL